MSDARKTLFRFFCFLVLMGAGTGVYVAQLERDAARVDSLPYTLYDTPIWSEDESAVAYYATSVREENGQKVVGPRELWRCSRVGGDPVKLNEVPEKNAVLLGWVDDGTTSDPNLTDDEKLKHTSLLVQPQPENGVPRILLFRADTGERQEIRFEREGLSLIGARGGDIYFQREITDRPFHPAGPEASPDVSPTPEPSPAAVLTRKGVDLLKWTPGKDRFSKVVSVPSSDANITIEDAMPSPDDHWVVLVLRVDNQLSLWLYNQQTEKLSWTNIKVEASAVRVAWSPDSKGLVAAAEMKDGCDLFALWNVESNEYTRLKSSAARAAYRPFWPRGERYFLLLDRETVFQFQPETSRAELVLNRAKVGMPLQDLNISPTGSWAVFHSREGERDGIYYWSMKIAKEKKSLLPPDPREQVHDLLWYQVAEGLRYAGRHWFEGK